MNEDSIMREIEDALRRLGVDASCDALCKLREHLRMVMEANREFNLTAVREESEAVITHIADSVAGLSLLAQAPAGPFADLGSGAGYPGIPLAVLTGRPVTLVESTGKKARFLADVLEKLALPGEVRSCRAEELASEPAAIGAFSAITARAIASLPAIVELASPLLHNEGSLLAYKGDPGPEEVASGRRVANLVGMRLVERHGYSVGLAASARSIFVFRKTGPARVALPRRTGLAQKKPLA